jgi:hypothetical protein
MVDTKGKGRATEHDNTTFDDQHWGPLRESDRWTIAGEWKASRKRAKADKRSWDYGELISNAHLRHRVADLSVLSSGVAGGIAGCVVSGLSTS